MTIDDAYEAKNCAFPAGGLPDFSEFDIGSGESPEELVARWDVFQGGRDEGGGLHGEEVLESRESGGGVGGDDSGEDGEFSSDVLTVEIVAWMWFLGSGG